MLYLELLDPHGLDNRVVGAVFARNSGTENKIAAYARGLAGWDGRLCEAAAAMHSVHIATMKDERLPEVAAARAVLSRLPVAVRDVPGPEADVAALLHAMVREGSVVVARGVVSSKL